MSEHIGKKVFVQVSTNDYSYSRSDLEWVEGIVAGEFNDGDLLISYDETKHTRESLGDVAFTKDDEIPPVLSVKMEELAIPPLKDKQIKKGKGDE